MKIQEVDANIRGEGWFASVGGTTPVQGEGMIDGREFYFRARGRSWALLISMVEGLDPLEAEELRDRQNKDAIEGKARDDNPPCISYEGIDRIWPAAGYMTTEEVACIIGHCAALFRFAVTPECPESEGRAAIALPSTLPIGSACDLGGEHVGAGLCACGALITAALKKEL